MEALLQADLYIMHFPDFSNNFVQEAHWLLSPLSTWQPYITLKSYTIGCPHEKLPCQIYLCAPHKLFSYVLRCYTYTQISIYSWPLKKAGVMGADPSYSWKSTCNFYLPQNLIMPVVCPSACGGAGGGWMVPAWPTHIHRYQNPWMLKSPM